jgi:hypothetical protein
VQCTDCGSEWPDGAVLCVECGLNFQTGKRLQTVRGKSKKGVTEVWDRDLRGSTPRRRIVSGIVFLVVLSVLLVVLPFIPQLGGFGLVILGVPVYLFGFLATLLLCGSFTLVRVEPGRGGNTVLTIYRYFFFVPCSKRTYRLRDFKTLWTDHYMTGDADQAEDVLTLDLGGDEYDVLARVRVFQGADEIAMRQLCELLQEAGGLEIKRR